MSGVLVPEFTRRRPGDAWRLFCETTLLVVFVFAVATVLLSVMSDTLVSLFAPGFTDNVRERAAALAHLALWSIPLTAAAAVSTAFLQSRHRFAVPAAGTLIFNLMVIACLLIPMASLRALAIGVLIGAALRWMAQLAATAAVRPERSWINDWKAAGGPVLGGRILRAYGEALGTGVLFHFLPVFPYVVASLGAAGSLAVYNYTVKLIMVPAAVLGTIFAVVLYPSLSGLFQSRDGRKKGVDVTAHGLRLSLTLAVASALSLGWFGTDIARLLFGHGRMPMAGVSSIGNLLAIGVVSLPAHSISAALQAILFASGDTRSAFIAMLTSTAIYMPLILSLQWAFDLQGVMGGYVIASYIVCIGYSLFVMYRHNITIARLLPLRATIRTCGLSAFGFSPVLLAVALFGKGEWGVPLAIAGGAGAIALPLLFDAEARMVVRSLFDRRRSVEERVPPERVD